MSGMPYIAVGLALLLLGGIGAAPGAARPIFRKPPPEGVSERTSIAASGGIVELADGSWMLAQGSSFWISTDQGQTWGEPQPLGCPVPVAGLIRLQSGALAVYGREGGSLWFVSSADEGRTWGERSLIVADADFHPLNRSMIQMSGGRLLLTGYSYGPNSQEDTEHGPVSVNPELQYGKVGGFGEWRGHRIHLEGHHHAPEMGGTRVYRTDDEGATWQKHVAELVGWFDCEGVVNGNCGQTPVFEPTIAETADSHLLMLARSTVGRLVQSRSADGGELWCAVKPTELPACGSPAVMATLPTGDLLLVWNQLSREEIRRGYRRGRLSAALSRDGGHSWGDFKTLELTEGLEDLDRLPPEYPIRMVRARDWVGALPDGYARFSYPNVDVLSDRVVIRYARAWFVEVEGEAVGPSEMDHQASHGGENVLRVYPVEWFYE